MRDDLIERLRSEADISARPAQMDRLHAIADEFAAAFAADAAADAHLSDFAEGVVQILIAMDAPGCAFLHLTEAA